MFSQLTGQGDWMSTLIWLILFVFFIFFGPRMMTAQSILKLEKSVIDLEGLAQSSKKYLLTSLKSGKKKKADIDAFMDFFAVSPVDLDPYGIVRKIDHVVKNSEDRFRYFVNQIAPEFSDDKKEDFKSALAGAMMTHQIAKIVRHYLETIKKYKMFQLAMIIQMQLPLIERIAKAAEKATKAFVDGVPIGDGVGPLVAANLMKGKTILYKEQEFAVCKTNIDNKDVFVAKAMGPGASTGQAGKFLQKFVKKNKITRILTIDAAMRLEGEKAGSVAEGVGIAMGGIGVERYEIEEIAIKSKMPLDAIGIKVSDEEALSPMKKEVFEAVPDAIERVKENLKRASKDKVLIIGVGNTCGVGNNHKDVAKAEEIIKKAIKKAELEGAKKGFFKKKSL